MDQRVVGNGFIKKTALFSGLDLSRSNKKTILFGEESILRKEEKFTQIYFNEADPTILAFCENNCFRSWLCQPPRKSAEKCAVQHRIFASHRLASRDFAAEKAGLFLYSAMEITTYNTELKKRLGRYAAEHPELCRVTEIDDGRMSFEIDKRRCSLRLTKPYTEERLEALREAAQEHGIHTHADSRMK